MLNKCQLVDIPGYSGNKSSDYKSYSYVVRMYSHKKAKIKKIYIPSNSGPMQVAIYADNLSNSPDNGFSSTDYLIAYNKQYGLQNKGNIYCPAYVPDSVNLDSDAWEFYNKYDNRPSTTINEAIVIGLFAISISVNWEDYDQLEAVAAELLPFGVDILTSNDNNAMNFKYETYAMDEDLNPTMSIKYTAHSSKSDKVSMSIMKPKFKNALNFVPYVKVVLEPVED